MDHSNLFLVGKPRIGKSTICEKILDRLTPNVRGFITREIQEEGERTGFELETVHGKKGKLSSVDFGPPHVGKYGVDVDVVDNIAVVELEGALDHEEPIPIVIDEVGKMEILSDLFRETLLEALDSAHPVVATAPQEGPEFIENLKERGDSEVILVTKENRDDIPEGIIKAFAGKNAEEQV